MSSGSKAHTSSSLYVLYGVGLGLNQSRSFSTLPPSRATRNNTEEELDIGEISKDKSASWHILPGSFKSTPVSLGLLNTITRLLSLSVLRSSSSLYTNATPLKHLLIAFLRSFGYTSLAISSNLFVLLRAMFASRIYTVATRLGISPPPPFLTTHQGRSRLEALDNYKQGSDDVITLKERLEVANLAVKQLKSESLALQTALRLAGSRLERLERNQEAGEGERAAFEMLQNRYAEVMEELSRVRKENGEMRLMAVQVERLAVNEGDTVAGDEDLDRLTALARLQNQRLDSCIFPKDEGAGTLKSEGEEKDEWKLSDEASEDSIIIVTDYSEPAVRAPIKEGRRASSALTISPASTPVTVASPRMIVPFPAPSPITSPSAKSEVIRSAPPASEVVNACPIPVFTTVRPSLPPKVAKVSKSPSKSRSSKNIPPRSPTKSQSPTKRVQPRLKPLLLAARFAVSGSARKHGSTRKLNENSGNVTMPEKECGNEKERERDEMREKKKKRRESALNPAAPTFMPGGHIHVPTAITIPPTLPDRPKFDASLSPLFSPFIPYSPAPNSPFLRPPPQRRQSGDAPAPTSAAPMATPRSTRASSVRLIRERAAQREEGIQAKAMVEGKGLNMKGKMRLIGKGAPPPQPRMAFGELTNATQHEQHVETCGGRWFST